MSEKQVIPYGPAYKCRAKMLGDNPTFGDMIMWAQKCGLKRVVEFNGRYFELSPVSVDEPSNRGNTPAVQQIYPFLLLLERCSESDRDKVQKILHPSLCGMAKLLEESSGAERLTELKERLGHSMVIECRGQIFLLCDAMGDFSDYVDEDLKLIAEVRRIYPYLLQIEPDGSQYIATNILYRPKNSKSD